jgi:hypothetical protein
MVSSPALLDLARQIGAVLRSIADPALTPFLADWPAGLETGRAAGWRRAACAPPPVLAWMSRIEREAGGFAAALRGGVCRLAPELHWRQTYGADEAPAEFLRNYAYTELLGPDAPVAAARVRCGFLLLGPSTRYPAHQHPAEEIYLPLSGTARWQQGQDDWRSRPPGSIIRHASGETHAMQTDADPLLALYLWRGAQLHRKARLQAQRTP